MDFNQICALLSAEIDKNCPPNDRLIARAALALVLHLADELTLLRKAVEQLSPKAEV